MGPSHRPTFRLVGAALLGALVAVPLALWAGSVTIPHAFTNNAVADATQMNANFTAVKGAVDDNHARLSALEAPRPRDSYTRWGHADCAAGDEMLYTGWAYGPWRDHGGGSTSVVCMKTGDAGPTYNGAQHGSYLVALGTYYSGTDTQHQVPGVTAQRSIPCAVCATPKTCVKLTGTATCPAGWSTAQSGHLAGGYYAWAAYMDAFCYTTNNTVAATPNAAQNQVFSASTGDGGYMVGGIAGYRHVKCALCCK